MTAPPFRRSSSQAARFSHVGSPEVLKLEEVAVAEPGPGEVRTRQSAIGLNFADLSLRAGVFPAALPCCPGSEAAGIVETVGAGVTQFKRGDRVAYGGSPPGAYVSERVLAAALLAHLPDRIGFEVAAGMMSKGLTAAYLLRSVWPSLAPGDVVLLHAAAGGVGQIAAQWAKALGLIVIGTVGSRSKIAAAERARLTTELLGQVESGRIKLAVNQRHPLAEASRAHSELQARKTEGSSVLVP